MKSEAGGKTRYLILGLLSEGPMTGYDIRRITLDRFGFFWHESFGQIYPELRRMEGDGLVRFAAFNAEARKGNRKAKKYSITRKGTEVVREWASSPADAEHARFESVLKVYFGWLAPSAAFDRHIVEFVERHEESLRTLTEMEAELKRIPDPHANHSFALMTIDLGIRTYNAWIDWAKTYSRPGIGKRNAAGEGK